MSPETKKGQGGWLWTPDGTDDKGDAQQDENDSDKVRPHEREHPDEHDTNKDHEDADGNYNSVYTRKPARRGTPAARSCFIGCRERCGDHTESEPDEHTGANLAYEDAGAKPDKDTNRDEDIVPVPVPFRWGSVWGHSRWCVVRRI